MVFISIEMVFISIEMIFISIEKIFISNEVSGIFGFFLLKIDGMCNDFIGKRRPANGCDLNRNVTVRWWIRNTRGILLR
jgi:hypothetical protein